MEKSMNVEEWYLANKDQFSPPVCNKLMHKGQLSVMFVGGPNTREDFHLEEGAEFFWQMKGNMELPTIQKGQRKLVKIGQGQVFLLPSRIPHSPQRPEKDSLGLVIEREREVEEMDALRFYTDFASCKAKLWERFFHCKDLGKDLVPVLTEYKNSSEFETKEPTETSLPEPRLVQEEDDIEIPEPFTLLDWVKERESKLAEEGTVLNLFEDHPDKETNVQIHGHKSEGDWETLSNPGLELFLYQIAGESTVLIQSKTEDNKKTSTSISLKEGDCFVVPKGSTFKSFRSEQAITMSVSQDPRGNKKK